MTRTVARRYARALADILFAAKLPPERVKTEVNACRLQLSEFRTLLRQHAALRNVLASPAVPRERKLALLDQLRGRLGQSELTRNFLAVLLEHRRLEALEHVLGEFDTEVYARFGIVPVDVTTAVELQELQKKTLEARLVALSGSQVEMRFRVAPEILAGVVARLGSTIYDASLGAQLRRLQRQLTTESR